MRFGTYFFLQAPAGRSASEIVTEEVEQMALSEQLGYDSVWLTEHHYADYGLSSAPSVLAATVAARTSRLRIGLAVYVMPFHHPLRLAEETATLDLLSGGRLNVGLGRGNRPLEFVGHGVPQQESRSYLEEGVEVLLQAWTRDRVNFQGRLWRFENIPVYPKPLTQPHPPLAFAVGSPQSLAWAGRNGYAIMNSGLFRPLAVSLESRAVYEEAMRAAGHSDATIAALLARWVVTKHVYVAPTDEEAQADAEPAERWFLDSYARSMRPDGLQIDRAVYDEATRAADAVQGLDWRNLVEESLLVGSPETVRRKVAELQRAGVGELLTWHNFGGIAPPKARRSMRLFADEVIPGFRPSAVRPTVSDRV